MQAFKEVIKEIREKLPAKEAEEFLSAYIWLRLVRLEIKQTLLFPSQTIKTNYQSYKRILCSQRSLPHLW